MSGNSNMSTTTYFTAASRVDGIEERFPKLQPIEEENTSI
jgi:hypothetical protein